MLPWPRRRCPVLQGRFGGLQADQESGGYQPSRCDRPYRGGYCPGRRLKDDGGCCSRVDTVAQGCQTGTVSGGVPHWGINRHIRGAGTSDVLAYAPSEKRMCRAYIGCHSTAGIDLPRIGGGAWHPHLLRRKHKKRPARSGSGRDEIILALLAPRWHTRELEE